MRLGSPRRLSTWFALLFGMPLRPFGVAKSPCTERMNVMDYADVWVSDRMVALIDSPPPFTHGYEVFVNGRRCGVEHAAYFRRNVRRHSR